MIKFLFHKIVEFKRKFRAIRKEPVIKDSEAATRGVL